MSWTRRRLSALDDEQGTATVEFAILMVPLLITITWSILLTDLVQVKLKGLELARFITWESTVYRDGTAIQNEAKERFANLKSVDTEAAEKNVFMGLGEIEIQTQYTDQLEVKMAGGVPSGGGGIDIGGILGGVSNGVNTVINWMKLPKVGKARSDVTITVKNKIVPTLRMFDTDVKGDESQGMQDGFVFNEHYSLVYDTWKAWPNKNRMVGSRDSAGADPMKTYLIAEQLVSDQVGEIAYGKFIPVVGDLIGLVQGIGKFLSFFGLPNLIDDSTAEQGGPITMRPVDTQNVASWSPSAAANEKASGLEKTVGSQRWGDVFTNDIKYGDNPEIAGIDRSHYSLPYKPTGGHWNQSNGGVYINPVTHAVTKKVFPLHDSQYNNDYVKTYACRGHYYEGMIVPDGKPGDYRDYNDSDGCRDAADRAQSTVSDWTSQFGGFSLPSF